MIYCRMSLIRWMALRGVDVDYVDTDEEVGVQFELLLDDEPPSSKDPDGETNSSDSTTGGNVKVAREVKDSFITIIE